MPVLQGLILFPGVQGLVSATFTLTHGVTPSCATLYMAPQRGWVPKIGPLVVTFGGLKLTFPDCCADRMDVRRDGSGREIWAIHILDRRWKWKFAGRVSGYYNVRRGTGVDLPGYPKSSIVAGTEKTPTELCRLCLEAMGETRFDLSAVPEGIYPEVEWDYTLPAEALAQLCDQIGCRVVLGLDNRVRILPAGEGAALPMNALVTEGGIALDTPEQPDSLIVCTSRVRWQFDLPLEAVGKETDGTVKPIDELSYTPIKYGRRTWAYCPVPILPIEDARPEHTALAQESVWRWYRVKPPFRLGCYSVRGWRHYDVETLDRILPIEDHQIELAAIEDRWEPRPAWVWGEFDGAKDTARKAAGAVPGQPEGKAFYNEPFTVDRETGIVKFSSPVYLVGEVRPTHESSEGGLKESARLFLRTAFSLRDADTRGWLRAMVERRLPGPRTGAPPRYIRRDDLDYHLVYSGGRWRTNWAEIAPQADYYLDLAAAEYQPRDPATVSYDGFVPIVPDGAIQQVTWSVGADGRATTAASRNSENVLLAPTYDEQRLQEATQAALVEARKTSRQKARDREKGRA